MTPEKLKILDDFINHPIFSDDTIKKLLISSEIAYLIEDPLDAMDIEEIGNKVIKGVKILQEAWEQASAFKIRKQTESQQQGDGHV